LGTSKRPSQGSAQSRLSVGEVGEMDMGK
jgi:hypothetical protein